MTIQAQVSVSAQVFIPRDYQIFAGLDVELSSICPPSELKTNSAPSDHGQGVLLALAAR
jgi:hypothetical protein